MSGMRHDALLHSNNGLFHRARNPLRRGLVPVDRHTLQPETKRLPVDPRHDLHGHQRITHEDAGKTRIGKFGTCAGKTCIEQIALGIAAFGSLGAFIISLVGAVILIAILRAMGVFK